MSFQASQGQQCNQHLPIEPFIFNVTLWLEQCRVCECECGGVVKPGAKCDVCVLCGRGNDRILTVSKENIRGQVIFTKINLKCTACAFIVRCTSISPPSQQSAATNLNVKTPLFCRGRRVGRLKCSSPLLTRWLLTAQLVGAGSNTEVHTTQTQTLMAGWQTVLIS